MGPVTIAVDSYGPVTDNAQSVFELSTIEEMPGIEDELARDYGITADFERAKRLRADEIVPEKELIRARSEFEKAQATARAATDKLKLLDATHSDNESGPNSIFAVKAPFKGTIIEKQADYLVVWNKKSAADLAQRTLAPGDAFAAKP